jgi:hypothetical protein
LKDTTVKSIQILFNAEIAEKTEYAEKNREKREMKLARVSGSFALSVDFLLTQRAQRRQSTRRSKREKEIVSE